MSRREQAVSPFLGAYTLAEALRDVHLQWEQLTAAKASVFAAEMSGTVSASEAQKRIRDIDAELRLLTVEMQRLAAYERGAGKHSLN